MAREKRTDIVRIGLKLLTPEPPRHGYTRESVTPLRAERPESAPPLPLRERIPLPKGAKREPGRPWTAHYARPELTRTKRIDRASNPDE